MYNFKLIIISVLLGLASSACAQGDTMYVDEGTLYTAAGEKVVLRGMNEMYVWSTDKTGSWSLAEIAKTGANCVRLVWSEDDGEKDDLVTLIENCIDNKMIAMPECHDATGDWSGLWDCVNFWNDSVLIEGIQRNKKWTLLNIGNEVGGNNVTADQFTSEYQEAIDSIRSWGYTVPIVIDASKWGQNVAILIATWEDIYDHDPLKNVIFSTHSYWSTTANYTKVVESVVNDSMPLIIGEGPSIALPSNCSVLDFETGLQLLGENDVSWLSWSWGLVNNGDCLPLFDHTTNGYFGNWETEYAPVLVFEHEYSLMRTVERPASFYENDSVIVSGIAVAPYDPYVVIGDSAKLEVIPAPANAVDTSYSIELEQDEMVISFSADSSYIYGLASGTATITATHPGTGLKSSTSITVGLAQSLPSLSDVNCTIYPIPLDSGDLTVDFSEEQSGTVSVWSTTGKMVYRNDFDEEEQLSVSKENFDGLSVAILQIQLPDGVIVRKIVIDQ